MTDQALKVLKRQQRFGVVSNPTEPRPAKKQRVGTKYEETPKQECLYVPNCARQSCTFQHLTKSVGVQNRSVFNKKIPLSQK